MTDRVEPVDVDYLNALGDTLSEWNSPPFQSLIRLKLLTLGHRLIIRKSSPSQSTL